MYHSDPKLVKGNEEKKPLFLELSRVGAYVLTPTNGKAMGQKLGSTEVTTSKGLSLEVVGGAPTHFRFHCLIRFHSSPG